MGIRSRVRINGLHASRCIAFVKKTSGFCEFRVQSGVFHKIIVVSALSCNVPCLSQKSGKGPSTGTAIIKRRSLRDNNIRIGDVAPTVPDSVDLVEWAQNFLGVAGRTIVGELPEQNRLINVRLRRFGKQNEQSGGFMYLGFADRFVERN